MGEDVVAKYHLPLDVRFCKKCVISNQRPRITIDDQGVCSACLYAEQKQRKIDWEQREQALRDTLNRFRKKNGEFDVIVPVSGGKDSTFVAWELKHRYDMHPLTVTWAPCIPSPIGLENFYNFISAGFPNIQGFSNGQTHRALTRLGFLHLGEPFQPFVYGQKAFPLQMAVKYNVPLVMYGENGEVEYGGDTKNADSPTHDLDADMLKHYFSGVGPLEWAQFGIAEKDLQFYMPPPLEELHKVGVECHFMGYYKKWNPRQNYEDAVHHANFRPAEQRSEGTYTNFASLDDKIDGMHYYLSYIKFGIGRATADAAHEIREGRLTREEGVRLVHLYDGEFPARYHQDFLTYTGLSEAQCQECIDGWRSPHLWEKTDGTWKLKHRVC